MDAGAIKDWLGAAALVLSLGTAVYSVLTARSKGNSEHLKAVDKTLTDHDRRVQAIEQELRHLPAKDDVNELKLAIAEMKGAVAVLGETVSGASRTIRRVEDFLMKERP